MQYGSRGDYFFHYTSADTAFRHILSDGTLQLSPYTDMRDPLEAKEWHLSAAGFVTEGARLDEELIESVGLAQRAKQQSKLLSFSVDAPDCEENDPFGRGYALASMWELYADKHAGVCLVFDRERLTTNLCAELSRVGRVFHKPVRYDRKGIAGAAHASTLILGGGRRVQELITEHIEAHHEALLFTKLADWEHESEYRFVVLSEETDPVRCHFGDALRAVIVGHAFPDWQVPSALELCREAEADSRKLLWEMSRPLVISLRRTRGTA